MKFTFIYEPVPLIIVRDIFTKKENKEILAEAVKNKKKFEHAVIGAGKKTDFRSNKVAYYDTIFMKDRSKSKLLSKLDVLFKTPEFNEILSSAPHPINQFNLSNYHETQISRYGDGGQLYKYHIDAFSDTQRQLTMVYYFNEEPKKYKGGEIVFTRSPIYKGTPVDSNEEQIKIIPENNMAVIFGSHTPHSVLPTTSPKTFNKGRFSMNCWIGRR
jgi:Rps23 Pro-64 3,4-dihydroxylase Tpa1-like proline 4-hydroxylase